MGVSTSKPLDAEQSDPQRTLDILLERNHREHHILWNNHRFANHCAHTLCTVYALGADSQRLKELYDIFHKSLLPLEPRVAKITDDNWRDFLGDDRYYQDYLDFFDAQLSTPDDIPRMMDKYGVQLLQYSIGHAAHPLIHLGFGVEFQKPLVVSEALAWTCINYSTLGNLVDPDETSGDNMAPLDIVEAIRLDPAFDSFPKNGELSDEQKALVKQYLNKWNVGDPSKSLDDLFYSLSHAVLLLYATTPIKTSPKPDFFIMHLLTSFHAVQSLISRIPPTYGRTLLKSHLLATLTIYINSGRPPVHAGRMEELSNGPAEGWDEIVRIAIGHPDEHFPKVIRALKVGEETFAKRDRETGREMWWRRVAWLTCETVKSENDWS